MYCVMNRVWVKPEYYQEFETRFQNRAGQIDKQPGFVRMQILKPESDDTPFVVYTLWESQASFMQWTQSDDFKLAHQNPMSKDAFYKQGGLEQFHVVISSDAN